MSKNDEDLQLEEWEEWMKNWLLDPFTSVLDEKEFRIDLYEATDSFIVEVKTDELIIDEITVAKNKHKLNITIMENKSDTARFRTIDFPFNLENHHISIHFYYDFLEIRIQKDCSKKKTARSIRLQGNCRKDE